MSDTTTKTGAAATSEGTTGTTTDTTAAKPADGTTEAGTPAEGGTTAEAGKEGTDGTSSTESGSKAGETPQPKAPEKYALKIPEGGEHYLGPDDLTYLEGVARASDWTDDDANAEIVAAVERAKARETAMSEQLKAEFLADKDYGGEKLEETQKLAKTAIDRVFPAGHRLREPFLQAYSRGIVGNNLVYVGFLAEVGRLMGEDSVGATRSSGPTKDVVNTMYDHPTSKALNS